MSRFMEGIYIGYAVRGERGKYRGLMSRFMEGIYIGYAVRGERGKYRD